MAKLMPIAEKHSADKELQKKIIINRLRFWLIFQFIRFKQYYKNYKSNKLTILHFTNSNNHSNSPSLLQVTANFPGEYQLTI